MDTTYDGRMAKKPIFEEQTDFFYYYSTVVNMKKYSAPTTYNYVDAKTMKLWLRSTTLQQQHYQIMESCASTAIYDQYICHTQN